MWLLLPGIAISAYIRMCTYKSIPPPKIFFGFSIVAFVMSIMWISFTSDIVIDLLQLFGFILKLPSTLLGLTLLAWGNCLGDMNANVAMTKRGFGEMAITGCMAGPIFNILVGMGTSNLIAYLNNPVPNKSYSIFDFKGNFVKDAVVPLVLIISQLVVLTILGLNGFINKFKVSFKFGLINLSLYTIVILSLVIYSLYNSTS